MSSKRYIDFGTWITGQLGCKVQKLSVDAGFTCPNRDGRVGWGGCTFCDNSAFSPSYLAARERRKSVTEQLNDGKAFFSRKYPAMRYLAYFQSYSNTYAPLSRLRSLYEEALSVDDVVGIVIGTRPDCVSAELLDYLAVLARKTFVLVEYGVESVDDDILRGVNRGHDFRCALDAVRETASRGIYVGAHIILGLPRFSAECRVQSAEFGVSAECRVQSAECHRAAQLCTLHSALCTIEPLDGLVAGITRLHEAGMTLLKLHQLQIIRGTRLENQYSSAPFHLYSAEEYIGVVAELLRRLPKDIVYDRFVSQSPPGKVLAPSWGLKNHEFTHLLDNRLVGMSGAEN